MFRRRLFPPTLDDDDTGETVTEQTLERAQRSETGEGVSIGQTFDSAHDENRARFPGLLQA
jgi:hypothetical protein